MRLKIKLFIGLIFSCTVIAASADNPFASSTTSQGWELLRHKWLDRPPADLIKAAKAGNPEAQYFYWVEEFNGGNEDLDRAAALMRSAVKDLSRPQRIAAENKWKTADEAERNNAAAAG